MIGRFRLFPEYSLNQHKRTFFLPRMDAKVEFFLLLAKLFPEKGIKKEKSEKTKLGVKNEKWNKWVFLRLKKRNKWVKIGVKKRNKWILKY